MPYYESTYHLIYKLENIISYSTTYITLMPYSAKIVTLCHVTTLLAITKIAKKKKNQLLHQKKKFITIKNAFLD